MLRGRGDMTRSNSRLRRPESSRPSSTVESSKARRGWPSHQTPYSAEPQTTAAEGVRPTRSTSGLGRRVVAAASASTRLASDTPSDATCKASSVGTYWNKGKLVGQKAPFKLKEIWAIRVLLQLQHRARDLALFNLGIDSKLRACDLVRLRVRDVCHGSAVASRAIVMQQKIERPVQFEITAPTRDAVAAWIERRSTGPGGHLNVEASRLPRPDEAHRPLTRTKRADGFAQVTGASDPDLTLRAPS